jgi:hypothetical protein
MTPFKTLAMVGLLSVGMVYGEIDEAGHESTDEIDRVIDKLNPRCFDNGIYKPVKLPANAPIEEVVCAALGAKKGSVIFEKIRVLHAPKLTSDSLNISTFKNNMLDGITAVLADWKDHGRKVILLRYDGDQLGWWNREYDIPPTPQ